MPYGFIILYLIYLEPIPNTEYCKLTPNRLTCIKALLTFTKSPP